MAIQINYVWFGDGALGALEKFNIYSWKLMGHDVAVYACKWNTEAHTGLGVNNKVKVIDLYDTVVDFDKKLTIYPKTRELLTAWFDAAQKKPPTKPDEFVYNVVDLTKSYLGGSKKGIVLDLKAGPSPHVDKYLKAFEARFISYTRAGKTAGDMPENQCMGTMEKGDAIRLKYATRFEAQIVTNFDDLKAKPANSWFNAITGFHGRAAFLACKYLDVATKAPDGKVAGKDLEVAEIGAISHGPFRVYKRASDQTNQGGTKTTKKDVYEMCKKAWDDELSKIDGPCKSDVESALGALPKA